MHGLTPWFGFLPEPYHAKRHRNYLSTLASVLHLVSVLQRQEGGPQVLDVPGHVGALQVRVAVSPLLE